MTTSLKFIHLGHMTEISLSFLIQSYLSCVVVFIGLYTDIQAFDSQAFTINNNSFYEHIAEFSYFSFAVMTLCGSGLNVAPLEWYSLMFVCFEMILGILFHVVIFGLGLLKVATQKYNSVNKKLDKMRKYNKDGKQQDPNVSDIASTLILSTLMGKRR